MRLAVALFLAAAAPAAAQAADVQQMCAQTVNGYAAAWDRKDAAKFGALFAEDATLDLAQPVKGKAAIGQMFATRTATSTTRHLVSNIEITPGAGGTARGVSYLLLFSAPGAAAPPLEAANYTLMAEYHDEFAVRGGQCLITSRKLVPVFRRPRPAESAPAATPAAPAPR